MERFQLIVLTVTLTVACLIGMIVMGYASWITGSWVLLGIATAFAILMVAFGTMVEWAIATRNMPRIGQSRR